MAPYIRKMHYFNTDVADKTECGRPIIDGLQVTDSLAEVDCQKCATIGATSVALAAQFNAAHGAQDEAATAPEDDPREWTEADTALVVRANVATIRALRNVRDFGAFATWIDIETADALVTAGYLAISDNGPGYRITPNGLAQLK